MILGIDPSFTGTGLCLFGEDIKTTKISVKGACYSSIVDNHNACKTIGDSIISFIGDNKVHVICEYPAFATRSGAYLAILNGYLSSVLQKCPNVLSITWVPPTACDSFTKNKEHSKTYLVEWCKHKKLITKRTSHDECTAIILAKLWEAIRNKQYKNSYFIWSREDG